MSVTISPLSLNNTSVFGTLKVTVVTRSTFHKMLETDIENVFLNTLDFAEVVMYTHKTGESTTYNALYNDAYDTADVGSSAPIAGRNVIIKIHEKKLKRLPTKGDIVICRGIKYIVDDFRPDGVGMLALYLDRYINA